MDSIDCNVMNEWIAEDSGLDVDDVSDMLMDVYTSNFEIDLGKPIQYWLIYIKDIFQMNDNFPIRDSLHKYAEKIGQDTLISVHD